MNHPRTKQGYHGRKGGSAGNCDEARIGGNIGAADAHKGGAASRNSTKSKICFTESLRIVELFLVYDNLPELLSTLAEEESNKLVTMVRSFVYGEHHNFESARMQECIRDWLCEGKQRLDRGDQGHRKARLRPMLQFYVAKGPDGSVLEVDDKWVPIKKGKIKDLAKRLSGDSKDRVKLGQ